MNRAVLLVAALFLLATARAADSPMLGCSASEDATRCHDLSATVGSNKFTFSDGATLEFTADKAGAVTLRDAFTNAYHLPTQSLGPLVFGSQQTTSYGVFASSSITLTNVKLTTIAISSSSSGLITSSTPLAVLRYSDSGDDSNPVRLDDSSISYSSGIVVAMLPGTGVYLFPAMPSTINGGASGNVLLAGHSRQTIAWTSGLSLFYDAVHAQTIDSQVTKTAAVQAGVNLPMPTDGSVAINEFFRFDVTGTNDQQTSTVKYTYSSADVAGLSDASCLRLAVYLPKSGDANGCDCWTFPSGQSVDQSNRMVTVSGWSYSYFPQWWGLFSNCGSSSASTGASASDACSSSPCMNGGSCTTSSSSSSSHDDSHDSSKNSGSSKNVYTCACRDGYTGDNCESSNACSSSPCKHGSCTPSSDGSSFTCSCSRRWIGAACDMSDPCSSSPCQNGGSCDSSANDGSFTCSCANGYYGSDCSTMDPCMGSPCRNGASCKSSSDWSSYACSCERGWYGSHCDQSNPCFQNPCMNGGSCTASSDGSSFTCSCLSGFSGNTCQTSSSGLDACSSNPCSNGGKCSSANGAWLCSCSWPFAGADCSSFSFSLGSNTVSLLDGAKLNFNTVLQQLQSGWLSVYRNFNWGGFQLPTGALGPIIFNNGNTQSNSYTIGGVNVNGNTVNVNGNTWSVPSWNLGDLPNNWAGLSGVSLTTPPIDPSSLTSLLGNPLNRLAVLWYPIQGQLGNAIRLAENQFSYDPNTHQVTVRVPGAGTYVFTVMPDMINGGINSAINLAGNSGNSLMNWANGFYMNYNTNQSQNIAASLWNQAQAQAGALAGSFSVPNPTSWLPNPSSWFNGIPFTALGPYIHLATSSPLLANASMYYHYGLDQLDNAGITNPNNLRFCVWLPKGLSADGCDCWRCPCGQSVNQTSQIVSLLNYVNTYTPQWWGLFQPSNVQYEANCSANANGASSGMQSGMMSSTGMTMTSTGGASGAASGASGAASGAAASGASGSASGAASGASTGSGFNPCSSQPCANGATCFNADNTAGFSCQCAGSWTGGLCNLSISPKKGSLRALWQKIRGH